MRVCLFIAVVTICSVTVAQAQSRDDTLHAPSGALKVLGVPVETNRAFAMLRAIRVLYSSPRVEPVPTVIADFEGFLDAHDALERELQRAGDRSLSLAMAASAVNRDVFRDAVEALGLRVREQQRAYSVEPRPGNAAAKLRTVFLEGGIDVAGIQKRLNAGETVHITPVTVALPLPLPSATWTAGIFNNRVTADALFNAIIRSREASLLYYGVQSMTVATREYIAKTPDLMEVLYSRAPLVAGFGSAFRVGSDGRVHLPGGDAAEELWEDLADETLAQPVRFARAFFGRDGGRLAYFADTLWTLDEAHARFALGLWIDDQRLRKERFRALYDVFAQMDASWSPAVVPFTRPSYDAALLLSTLQLNDARLATPAHRKLWDRGVNGIEIPAAADRQMRDPAEDGIADAAFLAGLLSGKLPRERQLIIERIAFGQRNFAAARDDEMPDVLVALRGFGRFPTAMLALERIGLRKPPHFAMAARRAAAFEPLDRGTAVPLLAQFQASLALLERLARTGAVSSPALEHLAASLVEIEFDENRYAGAIANWYRDRVIPALPHAATSRTVEERLLEALVDRPLPDAVTFVWEGQELVIDPENARRELRAARERQKGNTLDSLLELYEHAAALNDSALTIDAMKLRAASLRTGAAKLAAARPWPEAPDTVPVVGRIVDRAVKDIDRIRNPKDVRKASRVVRPVVDALDYLLGETLVTLVYAVSLGDAGRGPAAAVDISHRHTFANLTQLSADRKLAPWRRPMRGSTAGSGDAVSGSLMGIDLALSKTRLRRLSADRLPPTPKLNDNDRATMTDTVALLNPRGVNDAQVAQIAEAARRGRERVQQAAGDPAALDALAVEGRIAPTRRGLLEWTARHASADVIGLFSLAEMFRLGGGQRSAIDGWGTSHESLTGCFCVRFPDEAAWALSAGRPDTGQAGARAAELNLRVAMLLADLRVPATLFPHVMALATQDYIENVPLVHPDDWVAIVGQASAISRERIEDYVSAVVATGPVRQIDAGAR